MQLICVAGIRPRLIAHAFDGRGVESAEVRSLLDGHVPSRLNRQRPTLLRRRIVEKRVGFCAQDLLGERRGAGEFPAEDPDLTPFDTPQQGLQTIYIHDFSEAIVKRLGH